MVVIAVMGTMLAGIVITLFAAAIDYRTGIRP